MKLAACKFRQWEQTRDCIRTVIVSTLTKKPTCYKYVVPLEGDTPIGKPLVEITAYKMTITFTNQDLPERMNQFPK
jgi:hypothetical protein